MILIIFINYFIFYSEISFSQTSTLFFTSHFNNLLAQIETSNRIYSISKLNSSGTAIQLMYLEKSKIKPNIHIRQMRYVGISLIFCLFSYPKTSYMGKVLFFQK